MSALCLHLHVPYAVLQSRLELVKVFSPNLVGRLAELGPIRLVWFRGPERIRTSFGTWTRLTVRSTAYGARSPEERTVLRLTVLYSVLPCICSSIAKNTPAVYSAPSLFRNRYGLLVGEVAYPGLAPSGEIVSCRRPNQNFRACPAARAPPSVPRLLAEKTPWGALMASPNADWLWQNAVRVHKRPYRVRWPPPVFFFSLFLFNLFSTSSLSLSLHPLILLYSSPSPSLFRCLSVLHRAKQDKTTLLVHTTSYNSLKQPPLHPRPLYIRFASRILSSSHGGFRNSRRWPACCRF